MFEGLIEGLQGVTGWGVAIALLAASPTIARGLRPAAKGAIKGCLALSDRARVATAETKETMQDLVAEAKSEYRTEKAAV